MINFLQAYFYPSENNNIIRYTSILIIIIVLLNTSPRLFCVIPTFITKVE